MSYIIGGIIKGFELIFTGDAETYSALWVTLRASSLSILASLVIGLPLGFAIGYWNFPFKGTARTILNTLLALPTVLIGLLVYAFISQQGPLGDLNILFSIPAIVVGQTILALPIVVALTSSHIESMDPGLRLTLLSLGSRGKDLVTGTLWEARYYLMIAAMTAYGRVISEVGISLMVGGNIKWRTRTLTTALALETGRGDFASAVALGIVLMSLAFAVNAGVMILRRRAYT
jgi:tungstate transport system permease protein